MAKCLVLGANGFIGSHLVDALVAQGEAVRAFDRFSSGVSNFNPHPSIEIMPGDFLNRHDLSQALEGVEYVFHFISTTTPATAEEDPQIDVETNVKMSIELFEECVRAGVKKVIFASTGGAIYGEAELEDGKSFTEQTIPLPVSPYAIGKLTIEHYLRYFRKKFGLESVVYRISNPYGERQSLTSKQGVIPIFLQRIARGEPLTIMGDGSMVRDYVYVKDIATMISSTYKTTSESVYNIGSGIGLSVNQIVDSMRKVVGKEINTITVLTPQTYVHHVVLNTNRFKDEFHQEPETPLDDGIRRTWEYVKKHSDITTRSV